MANEENKNENQENEVPAPEEQPLEGLTADQAAESPYDATEVWNKNKNSLFTLLGAIAIGVAAVSWFNSQELEDEAERSARFIEAGMEPDAAEERFLRLPRIMMIHLEELRNTVPRSFSTKTIDMRMRLPVFRVRSPSWVMIHWWGGQPWL